MAKSPAFQWYPSDWLSSTSRMMMTLEQQAAYFNLLNHDWMNDGIPADDVALAKLSEMGEGWLKGGSRVVRKCFTFHPTKRGFITNERLRVEREKQAEWKRKSSEGGKKSAETRQINPKGGSRVVEGWLPNGTNQTGNQKATLQSSSSSSSSSSNDDGRENLTLGDDVEAILKKTKVTKHRPLLAAIERYDWRSDEMKGAWKEVLDNPRIKDRAAAFARRILDGTKPQPKGTP